MSKKLVIILGVFFAALSAIFVRFSNCESTVLALMRMFFASIMLCPFAVTKQREEFRKLDKKKFLLCVLSGLFLGLHFACYFESVKLTSISSAVLLVDTEVFFTTVGGILFLREKQNGIGWLGICMTFFGSIVIAMNDLSSGNIKGDIFALLGAIFVAVYTMIGRKMRSYISTTCYTYIVYSSAAVLLFIVCLGTYFTGERSVFSIGIIDVLCALGLTIFSTLLGHSIFSWGLKYEKASFVSMVKLLEPLFASVMGIIIFVEIPSIFTLIGGCIVVLGILLGIKANN